MLAIRDQSERAGAKDARWQMPAQQKLTQLIVDSPYLSREEIFTYLRQAGYPERDIADSYNAAQRSRSFRITVQPKEPWLAALLSIVLPGLGHYYIGANRVAAPIMAAYALLWGLTTALLGLARGGPLIVALLLWATVSSYRAAKSIRSVPEALSPSRGT